MSKLKAIIDLEEQLAKEHELTVLKANQMIEEAKLKANSEMDILKNDYLSEVSKLKQEADEKIKLVVDKLAVDKTTLNQKFETEFENIVTKYVKKLKDEVTKI